MKIIIRINSTSHLAYIPEEVVRGGFIGAVDAFANAKTLTLVRPGASLEDILSSLKIVMQDIRLRMSGEVKQ